MIRYAHLVVVLGFGLFMLYAPSWTWAGVVMGLSHLISVWIGRALLKRISANPKVWIALLWTVVTGVFILLCVALSWHMGNVVLFSVFAMLAIGVGLPIGALQWIETRQQPSTA
jgi:hypothetical protein